MDSSGFSAADQASGEPVETEVNIGMKPEYHNGAAKGKIEAFKDIPEPLDHLLTPNRNTILHIHLTRLIEGSEASTYDLCRRNSQNASTTAMAS